MQRSRTCAAAALAAVLLAGCGDNKGGPGAGGAGVTGGAGDKQAALNDLKQLGLAYHNYFGTFNKAPANADELAPFFENNARLKKELEPGGRYVFIWNVPLHQMAQHASDTVLAYEKDADAAGNRAVVMGDGAPKVMNQQEFQAAPKAQPKQ